MLLKFSRQKANFINFTAYGNEFSGLGITSIIRICWKKQNWKEDRFDVASFTTAAERLLCTHTNKNQRIVQVRQ